MILLILFFSMRYVHQRYFPIKIDVVYTWVTHDRKLEQDIKLYDSSYDLLNNSAKYKDNEELKFSLRSIEKYANWVNHIYIVTREYQVPDWMTNDHERITIIHHSEIIPKEFLPTFNSICIESFLHRIPGLSEHYLYFNDDMILINPTSPSQFFDFVGKPLETKCSIVKKTENLVRIIDKNNIITSIGKEEYQYQTLIQFNDALLDLLFKKQERTQSQHIPSSNRVSYQYELDLFLEKIYLVDGESLNQETCKSKFRKNSNIARNSIFKKYFNFYRYGCSMKNMDLEYIEINHLETSEEKIRSILTSKKKFLCIQNSIAYNDIKANIGIDDYYVLMDILKIKFQEKSSFEK